MTRLCCTLRREQQYPLNRKLVGPQNYIGHYIYIKEKKRKRKENILPLLGFEPLVAILTTLSQLPPCKVRPHMFP
jgi:hypothetical protein